MALEVAKDSLSINQMIERKIDTIEIEGDVIIPDIKPDILNTITTTGNISIYKKEVQEGKIKIEGCINSYIMYLADDANSGVRSITTTLDFSKVIEVSSVTSDMILDSNFTLKSIECKVLNGRKVNLKASVDAMMTIYSNQKVEYIKAIEGLNDIQMLRRNFKANSLLGNGITKMYAKDTLSIDEVDNLVEIMKADIKIIHKELKVSYNKVLIKADTAVNIVYLTEDNRIKTLKANIPIMGFIDIPDITEDNICEAAIEIKNIVIKPNNMEEHSIYVEVEIEANCLVYADKSMEMIQDLYSPSTMLKFEPRQIEMIKNKRTRSEVCNIRKQESILEIGSSKIYDVEVVPVINTTNITNDTILYDGEVKLTFLYGTTSTVGVEVKTVTEPFTFSMASEGIKKESNLDTKLEIVLQDFVVMPDESIDMKIDIKFDITSFEKVEMNVIEEIQEEQDRKQGIFSMVIYYVKPGDSLWNIAKKFGSTVEDIALVNQIEDTNKIKPGQQLFIPRYVGNKMMSPA